MDDEELNEYKEFIGEEIEGNKKQLEYLEEELEDVEEKIEESKTENEEKLDFFEIKHDKGHVTMSKETFTALINKYLL
jgi:hypothetical protein